MHLMAASMVVATALAAETNATKEACATASEAAQRLQAAGKLLSARESLLNCVRPDCPKLVRSFCEGLLGEVTDSIPTVVLTVRDALGADIASAQMSIDGTPQPITGLSTPLDPGSHRISASAPGYAATSVDVVVLVTDRKRVMTLQLAPETAPANAPAPAAKVSVDSEVRANAAPRVGRGVAWSSAIAAALGFAGAGGLFGWAKADEGAARASCAPSCSTSVRDAILLKGYAADVALGVGLVAAVAAVVFFVLAQ